MGTALGISPADLLAAKSSLRKRLLEPIMEAFKATPAHQSRTVDIELNVHAVGIGSKITLGQVEQDASVRVYVSKKLPLSELEQRYRIPPTIDGIPTDIIEAPPAVFFHSRQGPSNCTGCHRSRPLRAGISVGHSASTGTIGYFCRPTNGDPSDVYILSSSHVLAPVDGKVGSSNEIFQPGPTDATTSGNEVATLSHYLKLDSFASNFVDAALARVSQNAYRPEIEIVEIGAIRGVAAPRRGDRVRMHGKSSCLVNGTIDDDSADAMVTFEKNRNEVFLFESQLRVKFDTDQKCRAGDSGALVVSDPDSDALGLFFAAPPDDGTYGWVNPIGTVLRKLDCSLL